MDIEYAREFLQIRPAPSEIINLTRHQISESAWHCRNLQKVFRTRITSSLCETDLSVIIVAILVIFMTIDITWSVWNRKYPKVCFSFTCVYIE